jgi:hypothetical protein
MADTRRLITALAVALLIVSAAQADTANWADLSTAEPAIVGGRLAADATTSTPDSPSARIDANVPASDFTGVVSINTIDTNNDSWIGSGTVISPYHILTAAHVVDTIGNDGVSDADLARTAVVFNNDGANIYFGIAAVDVHPDYTGFNNPAVNDDLAIITLNNPVPAGVEVYPLWTSAVAPGTTLTMVGYGRSGDGVNGFTVGPDFFTKRVGYNDADAFELDDEPGATAEVFEFDFDDEEDPGANQVGGLSLGNTLEAQIGGGDSGGPSFIEQGGQFYVAGVNTFGFTTVDFTPEQGYTINPFPEFNSGGGGMLVPAYADWITATVPEPTTVALLVMGIPLALVAMMRRRRLAKLSARN